MTHPGYPPVSDITETTILTSLPGVVAAARLAANRCYGTGLEPDDAHQEAWLWLSTPPGRNRVRHAILPDGTIHVRQLAADIWRRRLATIVKHEKLWREHRRLSNVDLLTEGP